MKTLSQGELFDPSKKPSNVEGSASGKTKSAVVPLSPIADEPIEGDLAEQDSSSHVHLPLSDTMNREGELHTKKGSPAITRQLFEEHSSLHLALWTSSFAICNLMLYHLFSLLFAGDLASNLIDARSSVYSIILSLLGIGASAFLTVSIAQEEHELSLSYKSLLLSIMSCAVLVVVSSIYHLKSFSLEAAAAGEQLVWVAFSLSWWVLFRKTLISVARSLVGFSDFHSGVSAPSPAAGSELSIEEGQVVRQTLEISKGVALVEERRGGGESEPVVRQIGDFLPAGSRILRGKLLGSPVQKNTDRSIHWFVQRLSAVLDQLTNDRQKWVHYTNLTLLALVSGVLLMSLLPFAGISHKTIPFIYSSEFVSQHWVLAALSAGLLLEVVLFSRFALPLALTRMFFDGAVVSSAEVFDRLARVQTVGFRMPNMNDFKNFSSKEGAGTVLRMELLDPRVDQESLCSVVFGVLRNTHEPVAQAVRRYCYKTAKNIDLFPVDDSGITEGGISVGTIQGATFLIGSEVALLEQGVQLELSDTLRKQTAVSGTGGVEHLFVSIGSEVVARFTVEKPMFSEMPNVVANLRSSELRPRLYGDVHEQEDLDVFGKEIGFELADIRTMQTSQDNRYGRALHISTSEGMGDSEICDLEIFLRAQDAQLYTQQEASADSVALTWFRPAIWNIAHEGVLLTNSSFQLIPSVLKELVLRSL